MANQAFFGMIGPLPEPTGENAPPDSPTLPVAARHHERQVVSLHAFSGGQADTICPRLCRASPVRPVWLDTSRT